MKLKNTLLFLVGTIYLVIATGTRAVIEIGPPGAAVVVQATYID